MVAAVENMAYVGETPWHGLGNRLIGSESIDQWRIAAGLDWEVEKRQLYYSSLVDGRRVPTPIEGQYSATRTDTQASLGIVSEQYKFVQPGEVLEFYRDLTEDNGMVLETAGSLNGGKKVWALARTGDDFRIKGQDELRGYLLLATSFDGTMATTARFTSVRVVCQNTLSLSLGEDGDKISITHRSRFDDADVKRRLGLHGEVMAQFEEDANRLAEVRITPTMATEFIERVLGQDAFKVENGGIVATRKAQKILTLTKGGKGQNYRSAQGTLWGLVNGVTEFVDHKATARSQDNRLNSAWFGTGDRTKSKAMQVALEMAAA